MESSSHVLRNLTPHAHVNGVADPDLDPVQSPETLVKAIFEAQDPNGPTAKPLERALEIISTQLNSNSGHFLLELLQNADDCKYPVGVVPTFSASFAADLSYSLITHCNEKGFSAEDVKGICDIGGSTKKESATTTGEKGIGFKSVFRLADMVWIASNGFTFKFDRSQRLGLIRPIWDPNFPVSRAGQGTSMLLRFPNSNQGGDFDTDTPWNQAFFAMLNFDDTHMLFLRQLCKIELGTYSGTEMFVRRDLGDETKLSKTLTCRHVVIACDKKRGNDDNAAITAVSRKSYIVLKEHAVNLSKRSSKRPSTECEVELAFPVDNNFSFAVSAPRYLYAFLPVKETNLRFLIQADFVLAANREDVEHNSKWNIELRDAVIPEVFMAAVNTFKGSGLRYTWPRYLSSASEVGSFFEPMMSTLLDRLRDAPVLETDNGGEEMAAPEQLVLLTDKYRYRPTAEHNSNDFIRVNGVGEQQIALIPSRKAKRTYLSSRYPTDCEPALKLIGVREMDAARFVHDFSSFVNDEHVVFAAQPQAWHECIAAKLLQGDTGSETRDKLKRLRIVPLVDGAAGGVWDEVGTEEESTLFFSDNDLTLPPLPRRIGLRLVDPIVQEGTQRFALLERLGVKTPSREKYKIHHLLEQWHRAPVVPDGMADDDLISHVIFLFRTNYQRRRTMTQSDFVDFFLATTSGKSRRSSETHFEAHPEFSNQGSISVLSNLYEEAVEKFEREALQKWMEEQLGVWSCPRLINTAYELSEELSVIRSNDPYRFLDILRSYWKNKYKDLLDDNDALTGLKRLYLRRNIQETKIECLDEETRALEDTILPNEDVQKLVGVSALPLLKIEAAEYSRWQFLSHFKVKMGLGVEDWESCLKELGNRPDIELNQVVEIYRVLQRMGQDNPENYSKVKLLFRSRRLIFVPADSNPEGPATWVSAQRCTWQSHGDITLVRYLGLQETYDRFDLRPLFVGIVGVDVTPGFNHLLQEATYYAEGVDNTYQNMRRIRHLCKELSSQLEHADRHSPERVEGYVRRLSEISVFPIRSAIDRSWSPKVYLLPASSQEWYIADQAYFFDIFKGRLDLLDFDTGQLEDCRTLLDKLNCGARFLSKGVDLITGAMKGDDTPELRQSLVMRLRERARYIDSLCPKGFPEDRISRMADIRIYSVKSVCVTWKIGKITSTEDTRRVVATKRGSTLAIYLRRADLRSHRPPVELAEELAFFFAIPRELTHLIQFIFTHDNVRDIEDTLHKSGITIIPEGEDTEPGPSSQRTEKTLDTQPVQRGKADPDKDGNGGQQKTNEPDDPPEELLLPDNEAAQVSPGRRTPTDGPQGDKKPPPRRPETSIRQPRQPREELYTREAANRLYHEMAAHANVEEDEDGNGSPIEDNGKPYGKVSGSSSYEKGRAAALVAGEEEKKTRDAEPEKLDQAMAQAERQRRLNSRSVEAGKRFGQLIQGSQAFRVSGPTNVYYVSDPSQLPSLDPTSWPRETLAVLESRMEVLADSTKNRAVFALLPKISSQDDVEDDFLGQAWVSQWLSNHLGYPAYDPNTDWRSSYRAKLGYRPHMKSKNAEESRKARSPFRITDETGALTEFFVGMGYKPARKWTRHVVTYYIDVTATRSDAEYPEFAVEISRFDKAREHRIQAGDKRPETVFIFVVISNIDSITAPRAAFYFDPWGAFADGGVVANITQNMLSLQFAQPADIEVVDATYQPPRVSTGWFSRVLTTMNRAMVPSDRLPEKGSGGVGTTRSPTTERIGPIGTSLYQWKPLQRPSSMIRLLRLYGGTEELYGTLVTYPLSSDERPRYTALSYTWGSGLKMFSLYMGDGRRPRRGASESNMGTHHEVIPITASLYLALRKLRPHRNGGSGSFIYVWADAVCIAQAPPRRGRERSRDWEMREKTEQIRLLAGIFTSAEMVVAWLGDQEAGDGSKEAIDRLGRLGTQLQDFMEAGEFDSGQVLRLMRRNRRVSLFDEFDIPRKEHRDWAAIGTLISRRWFSRVWIVQEVVLASRLVIRCGDSTIAWDKFYMALQLCLRVADLNSFTIADNRVRKNIEQLWRRRNDCWVRGQLQIKGSMFELLQAFHQKGATVPRDRLFALLSMATEESKRGLEPDYNLPLRNLVLKWGSAFVDLGHAFDMLYLARLEWKNTYTDKEHKGYNLPSWLPDLTAPQFPHTISTWADNTFQAGIPRPAADGAGESNKNPHPPPNVVQGNQLSLYGYIIDTIEELGPHDTLSNTADPRLYLQAIFSLIDTKTKTTADEKGIKLDLGVEPEDIKWALPIGGAQRPSTTSHWDRYDAHVTSLDAYRHVHRYLYHSSAEPTTAEEGEHNATSQSDSWKNEELRLRAAADGTSAAVAWNSIDANRVMAYIDTAAQFADRFYPAYARVCWTREGRVGLVPHVAREGDVVAVFEGGRVPFVLRANEGLGRGYTLVGEAYIYGVMEGEVLRGVGMGEMGRTVRLE